MRNVVASLFALLALALAGPAVAAEGEGGHEGGQQEAPHDKAWVQQKVETCVSCHGEKGVSQTANFPIIAGQYRDYLYHSLAAYRDGDRQNPVMAGQVQGLTDAQLRALAGYYAKQESPLHTPSLEK